MNFNQLVTELDPTYRAKVNLLHDQLTANAYMERQKSDEAMRREQYKAGESMRREQYKSQEESNRLDRRFSFEERLERQAHENRLLQLEESIKGSILKAGFDLMADLVKKSADEDEQRRKHTQEQFTIRSNLRADVFKMLAGAVIQEKLAQKQHERDKENRVWAMTEAYLLQTYKTAGEQATKREIDRLVSEWEQTA
jgi:hypothetical protein